MLGVVVVVAACVGLCLVINLSYMVKATHVSASDDINTNWDVERNLLPLVTQTLEIVCLDTW